MTKISDGSAPPSGWECEVPKYRVVRDLTPAPKARYRFEKPFTEISDNNVWQYAERVYEAGEVIESTNWPHPTLWPLNYSAEKVLEFFNGALKSRLPVSPWYGNRGTATGFGSRMGSAAHYRTSGISKPQSFRASRQHRGERHATSLAHREQCVACAGQEISGSCLDPTRSRFGGERYPGPRGAVTSGNILNDGGTVIGTWTYTPQASS
jgi:hypothetical protein